MSIQYPWSWCASVAVKSRAAQAYRFMADGQKQSTWALYSWNRKAVGNGIFVGRSLFDESDLYVKPVGHEQLLLVGRMSWPGKSKRASYPATPSASVRISASST